MLSGLASPSGGEIIYDDKNIAKIDKYTFRSKYIGVVFQSFNLITKYTALENVILSMDVAGYKTKSKKQRAVDLLHSVGLDEDEANRRVLKLSGGQQQRVAIARALSYDPDIILADEPTGNLDTRTTMEVMKLIKQIARDNNQTIVMVTHDPRLADFADKIIHILDGKIQSVELIEHPIDEFESEKESQESAATKEKQENLTMPDTKNSVQENTENSGIPILENKTAVEKETKEEENDKQKTPEGNRPETAKNNETNKKAGRRKGKKEESSL